MSSVVRSHNDALLTTQVVTERRSPKKSGSHPEKEHRNRKYEQVRCSFIAKQEYYLNEKAAQQTGSARLVNFNSHPHFYSTINVKPA